MNYQDAPLCITHRHDLSRKFESKQAAAQIATELNVGRPEACRPFRIVKCGTCKHFHVRRGKNVLVKAL